MGIVVITIGAHWSPLALHSEDEDKNNLIQEVLNLWRPSDSIGVGDFRCNQDIPVKVVEPLRCESTL